MNYKESKKIFAEIKKADRILITCHYATDSDSVASCLGLYSAVKDLGKNVKMISPSPLPDGIGFLKAVDKIEVVDTSQYNFEKYDLFLIPDIGSWGLVSSFKEVPLPKIKKIVIDHHYDNEKFGEMNLVDSKAGSACEVLYLLFDDWKIYIEKQLATTLLTGIIADTGAFQFDNATSRTLKISSDLLSKGANKDLIVQNILRSYELKMIQFWGLLLNNIKIEKEFRFAWSAVDYEAYRPFKELKKANSYGASYFSRMIKDTDFGIFMTEIRRKVLSVSLRERTGFDVSKIAAELGGGGHRSSAATEIRGLPFDKAVEKVLKTARKYAKQKEN